MMHSVEILPVQKPSCATNLAQERSAGVWGIAADYFMLTKPRLSSLVLVTTAVGFFMATGQGLDLPLLLHTLLGTALAAGGASALNMFLEQDIDALMRRTRHRPLPAGRLQPAEVFTFGTVLSLAGVLYLAMAVNLLCCLLGIVTITTYLFGYTPLKRKTSLCTVIGAVPGAIPPLIGWAAARSQIDPEAWTLFAILFLWQLPHFLAIAWRWREDYARAGCPMLSVKDPEGHSTARQILLQSLGLVVVSLLPTVFGIAGGPYFFLALALGCSFIVFGLLFAFGRSDTNARHLFLASLAYLPLLLIFLALDYKVF